MPYIITTKAATEPDAYSRFKERQATGLAAPLSRRAVATLDEARTAAEDRVIDALGVLGTHAASDERFDARELPEQGGTIGPLPDGTVIEVERVTYGQLRVMVDGDDSWDDAYTADEETEIIDAYNTAQGERV